MIGRQDCVNRTSLSPLFHAGGETSLTLCGSTQFVYSGHPPKTEMNHTTTGNAMTMLTLWTGHTGGKWPICTSCGEWMQKTQRSKPDRCLKCCSSCVEPPRCGPVEGVEGGVLRFVHRYNVDCVTAFLSLNGLAVSFRINASSLCFILLHRVCSSPCCLASAQLLAPHQAVDSMEVDGEWREKDEQEEAALRRPYFARPWAPNVRRM